MRHSDSTVDGSRGTQGSMMGQAHAQMRREGEERQEIGRIESRERHAFSCGGGGMRFTGTVLPTYVCTYIHILRTVPYRPVFQGTLLLPEEADAVQWPLRWSPTRSHGCRDRSTSSCLLPCAVDLAVFFANCCSTACIASSRHSHGSERPRRAASKMRGSNMACCRAAGAMLQRFRPP